MKKISVVSLGCAKNQVHSEHMMALLQDHHFELTDQYDEAEVIVINTCGFINSAKEESINTILELAQYKETGKLETLVAVGCLVQKYADELAQELPEIDLLLGTNDYDRIADILQDYEAGDRQRVVQTAQKWDAESPEVPERVITSPGHYAYLRIAEGCDNRCTYCVIPEMQGPYRSRPLESILAEARQLTAAGYSELILVAQDTTYYGKDLYGHFALADLLQQLAQIEELKWIRILYAYPNNFDDHLIDTIAREDKVCKYLDIPLQHADDQILRRMNRQITQQEMRALITTLRERIPNITLRSTFIVGFPGETEEQYQTLLDFLADVQLDCVGAFPYSQEEGTPAGRMTEQLEDEVKEQRAIELMDQQFEIMYDKHQQMIGTTRIVKVDELSPDVEGLLLCRSQGEAPDVDPLILVYNDWTHQPGDFLEVKITGLDEYDFIGEIIHELA